MGETKPTSRYKLKRTKEFCKELGCSPTTLWRYERDGIIQKADKINGQKTWPFDAAPTFDK